MASDPSLLGGPGQLPDDLREEASRVLQKVGAYLESDGDPQVMAAFKEPPGLMVLVFLSAALALILWIVAEIGNYVEIRNNWTHYQCMPSIAPFAKFYGHDLKETMNFCISQQVKEHAGGVITPIYKGVLEVQTVVDGVFAKAETVESGITGLLKGFETFVVNFMNSFRLLGVRVRMSVIRIKEIFQRVFGIFIAFAFAAISAITFGENLICNPLVTFVGTIAGVDICCFAPETRVRMADGSMRAIGCVAIGDRLSDGGRVTSCFTFDGRTVPMVSIHGVHVSANHSLWIGHAWVAAGDHPAAVPVPSRSQILCLSTTTNMIPVVSPATGVADLLFTDYEETSDPTVAAAAQAAAERALNQSGPGSPPMESFALGLDPTLLVLVDGGDWRPVANLAIGDRLANGTRVTGVVREWCDDVRLTPAGSRISAAQLVRGLAGRGWFRAGRRFQERAPPAILCQIFLDTNDCFTVANTRELWSVRDYQEWHGSETQEPYTEWLASQATKVDGPRRADTPCPYDDSDDVLCSTRVMAAEPVSCAAACGLDDEDDAGLADLARIAGHSPSFQLVDGCSSHGQSGRSFLPGAPCGRSRGLSRASQ
jgi:hypothetical protein